MWYRFSLRARIYLVLIVLTAIALSSGAVMVWYTYRIQGVFNDIMDRHMAAYDTTAYLETALVNQRGFVTYYFLDGDPDWLTQMGEYRDAFREHLANAREQASGADQREALDRISDEYRAYVVLKDHVIALYKAGRRNEGAKLHTEVRQRFFEILSLCENYKKAHQEQIRKAHEESEKTAVRLRYATVGTIILQMFLVVGLGILFIHRILAPVYRMLLVTTGNTLPVKTENVVSALSARVDLLLQDVDKAHHALEKSRENLLQAEKMALVGKLAAGMAHSIRNPFTSVKMRLFSLSRSLKMDAAQEEDFEVISHEIRHIDTIVQNFLEFSRPPKLVMQPLSPSAIVDNALQLLAHRLNSYGVEVKVVRSRPLPEVMADPEQLKEVLVNLIINACEEMKTGGTIVIDETVTGEGPGQKAVMRIADTGSGIPPSVREKIFQPFFTTKEEGTGLGLSIAVRILSEHGGSIAIDAEAESGAVFIVTLPLKEPQNGEHSNC